MQAAEKTNIRALSSEALGEALAARGAEKFRARQVHAWLWQKSARSFPEMSDLPKALRERLEEEFDIGFAGVDLEQESADGTLKCRFLLGDGSRVEGVLIPTPKRMTACISSQVGCNLGCTFCATGYMRMQRNLTYAEIYDQVVLLREKAETKFARPLTNIVFMGMGEPLLNYGNLLAGIERITSPDGLGISAKRITISTAGIVKRIRDLANDKVKCNLALSLHAADDAKRSRIMPITRTNPIAEVVKALEYFYEKTGNELTFEYTLLDGVNDSPEDAAQLIRLCRRLPVKVNLIEYNTIREADFRKTGEKRLALFLRQLETNGVLVKVRTSRGKDIDAACGQLANK